MNLTRVMKSDYHTIQAELDAALDAKDPATTAAAARRAQVQLARVAASEGFDPRRHRAISQALREVVRGAPPAAPEPSKPAPLTTRRR